MKLRHLILLISAIGASGALLLAADIYRRLKEAEAASVLGGPVRDDSVLAFGMYHTMGLLSLAFIFLSLFLMLLTSVREKPFVAAIETPGVTPVPDDAMQTAPAPIDALNPESAATPTLETSGIVVAPEVFPPKGPVPVEVVPEDSAPKPDVVPPASTVTAPAPTAEPAPLAPAAPVDHAPPASEGTPSAPEKRVLAFEPPASEIAPPLPAPETPPSPHSAEPAPPQDPKP